MAKPQRSDVWLMLIVIILMIGGLMMVYSASATGNMAINAEFKYLIRQLVAMTVGLVIATFAAFTPTFRLREYHLGIYLCCAVLLVLCLIPGIGHASHGASRWIGFGRINFQPSAFAKIAVLISLAKFLHDWRGQIHQLPILIKAAAIPVPLIMLIIIEPDFGSSLIIASLSFAMLVMAGMRIKHLFTAAGTLLVGGAIILMAADYRRRRVMTFWNPWEFKDAEGYQIIQGWIAMHLGGFSGQGLGNSVAKRNFLPEPWTDFIAAVIAEELGFIGLTFVILLFCAFLWRGLVIASKAKDAFSMYLAMSLTLMITGEAFFNLAVVMGLVPPKGLVLPFISYGASAMMANLTAIGLLLSISSESREVPIEQGWKMPKNKSPSLLPHTLLPHTSNSISEEAVSGSVSNG